MDLGGIHILLVDDDAADRQLLKRLLFKNGIDAELSEYTDAHSALKDPIDSFDAVFIDHNLSGSKGLSFLSEIREKWPRCAVFLMTGQGDETIAKSAIQEGATDYLSKSHLTATSLRNTLVSGLNAAEKQWRIEQQRYDLALFSEVLVHDFKAPIRAASYLAEQIEEDLGAGQISDVHDGLRLLKESADQMREMLSSLADHIRLDRDIEYRLHDPSRLIDGACAVLALDLKEASVRLKVEVDEHLPEIMCNGPQISQVLQNLIANALKFSEGHCDVVTVRVHDEPDELLFEVADAGCGIPQEHLDSIFLPFKRAPGSSKVGGTGLGLATCRKIVLRHNGRIWCHSKVGVGTKVFFSLPGNSAQVVNALPRVANETEELLVSERRLGL